jgi:hypothetical protein
LWGQQLDQQSQQDLRAAQAQWHSLKKQPHSVKEPQIAS